ncbi:ubiquinol-cytochrome c reductase iron-sulfur subunit [Marmoricola sp. RAF53]|uniref:QcrA and Rieske domain-containing protein n=1 Tax=Marmoricola sp. RAF53 TaxID=3233059 RepID=UPI003F984914
MSEHEATRRNVLYGAAAAGLAVPILAACGSSSGGDATGSTDPGATGDGSSSAPGGASGIKTSDIPVGGGTIYPNEKIVVTQPTKGEFKAFSAVCTHQGCLVAEVKDKTIDCNCHFSKYSIEDGSVEDGPAPKPLPEKTVTVTGDTLTVS